MPAPAALVATAALAVVATACGGQPAASEAAATAPGAALEVTRSDGGISAGMSLDQLCREHFAHVPPVEDALVGLMTDSGSVSDGTFNQFAYEGMQAAARCFGFDTTYLVSSRSDQHGDHLRGLLAQDVDAAITVGFTLADITTEAAAEAPDVAFIGVDQFVQGGSENYASLTYRDDQAGFLAGVAAALMSETKVLGLVAGPDTVPPVVALADGFEAGAALIDPSIEIVRAHLGSFSDPDAGAVQALAAIEQGADVVYAPAGLTGAGAILAAARDGQWVIGVDQDQFLTTFEGGLVTGADRIVTSSVKRVDLGVFLQLADLAQGTFAGGQYSLDASSGGITYAPPHEAVVPDRFRERLEQVRSDLATGGLRTGIGSDAGDSDGA